MKNKSESPITQAASDLINGLRRRYSFQNRDPLFLKHENKFKEFWGNQDWKNLPNLKQAVTLALVNCLLDDFNEITLEGVEITYSIGLADILATIDGIEITSDRGLDSDTLRIARSACSHYITSFLDLFPEKRGEMDRKYGEFLMAGDTLKMLNQFKPTIPED